MQFRLKQQNTKKKFIKIAIYNFFNVFSCILSIPSRSVTINIIILFFIFLLIFTILVFVISTNGPGVVQRAGTLNIINSGTSDINYGIKVNDTLGTKKTDIFFG